jgi:hypothetical protein
MYRMAIATAGILISVSLSSPIFAQSGKSSGEIAASSKLLAEKLEHCHRSIPPVEQPGT